MNDTDVLIKIVTAYEAGGIEAAKKAAQELKAEVDANSDAGKALSGALDLLNGKGQNAGQVFNGLKGILSGGQGAAAGFSKVIQGLGGALGMAAGPLAILTTGIGLAITAWQKYKQSQEEAAEAAKKAAEEEGKAAEEAAKALEERLANAADAARKKIEGIAEAFSESANASKELDDAMSAMGDAQLGLELAQIDAQMAQKEGESDADYAKRKNGLEQQKLQLKAAREQEKLAEQIKPLEAQLTAMDDAAAAAKKEVEKLGEALEEFKPYEDAVAAIEEANAAYANAKSKLGGRPWSPELEQAEGMVAGAKMDYKKVAGMKEGYMEAFTAYNSGIDSFNGLLAAQDAQRPVIQAKIDALAVKQQTKAIETGTASAKIQHDYEASLPKPEEPKPPEVPAPTPKSLSAEVGAMVGRGQRYGDGQLYDIDGGATRRQALGTLREAVNSAAASKGGDAEEAAIIAQAVEAIGSMGANLLADKAQINAKLQELVNAIQKAESQIKNAR